MQFGEFFKQLRKEKGFTQEKVASAIGKSKMLVSGIETGRNCAFLDEDLETISVLMELTDNEKNKLFYEASRARASLPLHLLDYMSRHHEVYIILDYIAREDMGSKSLKKIQTYVEELINVKNN